MAIRRSSPRPVRVESISDRVRKVNEAIGRNWMEFRSAQKHYEQAEKDLNTELLDLQRECEHPRFQPAVMGAPKGVCPDCGYRK
jgi:hypothetical protein